MMKGYATIKSVFAQWFPLEFCWTGLRQVGSSASAQYRPAETSRKHDVKYAAQPCKAGGQLQPANR